MGGHFMLCFIVSYAILCNLQPTPGDLQFGHIDLEVSDYT